MPQLRDSGNHSTAPLDAHTKDEIQSFARIFGIETGIRCERDRFGPPMRRRTDGDDDVPADCGRSEIHQHIY